MDRNRASIPDLIEEAGGLKPGVAREVSNRTGVPEAEVFGVGSFFHLLADHETKVRVCTGLSCRLKGADQVLAAAKAAGMPVEECSCLAACDGPPALLANRTVLPRTSVAEVQAAKGDWQALTRSDEALSPNAQGYVYPETADAENLVFNLQGEADWSGSAFRAAAQMGSDAVVDELKAGGLRGRGGAGFPAHIKWRGVLDQAETERFVVLNADEGEPGTFKDREILLRRPDLILEGLAIAAHTIGAQNVYLYLRGEFGIPWRVIEEAIALVKEKDLFPGVTFHMHAGQGAYICGEETALLEALEGRRGMPRLKPPFPVSHGLWQKPTLIHNVESIACLPGIITRGAEWFNALGRTEPGTKLYCLSGHVAKPGVYELPFGVTLDELVAAAGGYLGELKSFSPGGASSGFLPAKHRDVPLDFNHLARAGSMLGSAGIVVLNDQTDMKWAVRQQLRFFEVESCGQCAPCRIGTRFLRESLDQRLGGDSSKDGDTLAQVADTAWQMNEGSICGLGQAAPLPLTSALKYFPEDFKS